MGLYAWAVRDGDVTYSCEGNFDFDKDVDGTDAFVFKQHFGRSTLINPCPPDGPAPVERTGQTYCYNDAGDTIPCWLCADAVCSHTGQDGDWRKGASWPNPRFTDPGDGTVTDNLTGLMWTKDVYQIPSQMTWQAALDACNNLAYATHDDWRLPNNKEFISLMDYGSTFPALPPENPFINTHGGEFWTATSSYLGRNAWHVNINSGSLNTDNKTSNNFAVWAVRGGR